MKKFIHFILAIVTIFELCSCEKFLEPSPEDFAITNNFYQNEQQIDYAVAAIYSPLKVHASGDFMLNRATASNDDGYWYNGATLNSATFVNTNVDGDINSFWQSCYNAINNCNNLLENINNSDKVSADVKRHAIGETKFLRGYYYFILAQWFGDLPLHLKASNSAQDAIRPRTPVKEIYDQIIKDMTEADSLLYDQTTASLGYSDRVTSDAVEGILARVCLFAAGEPVKDTKRFSEALFWATKLKNTGRHSLNPDFKQVFINAIQDKYEVRESIWETNFTFVSPTSLVNSAGNFGIFNGVGNTYTFLVTTGTSYDSGYCYGYQKVHPRLYRKYEPGDVRRDWTISNFTYNAAVKSYLQPTQLWERGPAKWRREYEFPTTRSQQRSNSTSQSLLRYSDVLLMLAEAENEVNGPTAVAYEAINQVRRRAISSTPVVDFITMTNQGSGYAGVGYNNVPTVTIAGDGGTGLRILTTVIAGRVHLMVTNQGSGYTTAPIITIGTQWTSNTNYAVGTQVAANGRLYTVTTAGISSSTAPTQTTGSSTAATTGAVFTYVGTAATATATISAQPRVDLQTGLSKADFRKAVQDERSRELAFETWRTNDLKRWGILIPTVKGMAFDVNGLTPNIPAASTAFSPAALAPVNNITPRDIYWPVPLRDLILNPLMKQNPGF